MKCRKMILMKLFAGQQGFPGSSAGKESACNAGDPGFDSWVRKIRWRRDRLPTPVFLGFPGSSAGKEPACNVGDLGSIPGLGRSPGEGNGYLLQYFGLENSMNYIFHGVAKSRRWLNNFPNGDPDLENPFVNKSGKERVGWIERVAWRHIPYHT